jgi:hypothetical protein
MPRKINVKLYIYNQSWDNMLDKIDNGPNNTSFAIKFVPVQFEFTEYEKGQDELNESISQGWRIITDYPTSSGIVFSLRKNLDNHKKNLDNHKNNPEQKLMDEYCVDSMAGGSQK